KFVDTETRLCREVFDMPVIAERGPTGALRGMRVANRVAQVVEHFEHAHEAGVTVEQIDLLAALLCQPIHHKGKLVGGHAAARIAVKEERSKEACAVRLLIMTAGLFAEQVRAPAASMSDEREYHRRVFVGVGSDSAP